MRRSPVLVLALFALLVLTGFTGGGGPGRQPLLVPAAPVNAIDQHYQELGGASSFLGAPLGGEFVFAGVGGAARNYQGGTIYWSANTGAHEVHGAIRDAYRRLGGPIGFLGFPLTDEAATPGAAGRFNDFNAWSGDGGSIYWSASTGAHEVHGAIRAEYLFQKGPGAFLGFPLTDEAATPGAAGRYSEFTGGTMYWSPATRAHEVHGAIREHYLYLGGPAGFLGFPVTNEGQSVVGRISVFTGGNIYWNYGLPASELHGAILQHYMFLGGFQAFLGFPITDETSTPGGAGRYNDFSGAPDSPNSDVRYTNPASIYWSPATGAHEAHGAIRDLYWELGGAAGVLGFPTTDEMDTPAGTNGRYNHFSGSNGSSVYWTQETGAHEVRGGIRATWAALGWEHSRLGYPVTGEYGISGGRRSDFQHGSILWNSATSTAQVIYAPA
jgi:uncharacterized protein with LGFP repeats